MEYLPAFDFFGSYLHWYVNHKKKVYTRLGGIFSIISIFICIFILVILLKELIDRKNPQITENDNPNSEYKKIKFGEKKIYIPWTIGDYHNHQVNFNGWIYPIIYYFNEKREYKLINYTLCSETNLKNVDYFLDDSLNFDTLYCIDMDDLVMGGDWFHDSVYYIEMDFYLCENGVNVGSKGNKCTDYNKLMEYIGHDNAWHIEIYYPEIQFKPANKNNPMEIFYSVHFYNFNKLNTKVERLYLKEYTMIDDQGWIFENKKNYSLWGFDKLEYESYSISKDGDFITDFTSSKIYSLIIYINKNSKVYTRQYTKLIDAIGNILSIINGIFTFFKFFSQFFTEAYQDKEIVNNVFVQKYFMSEKYNKINKIVKYKNYSSNLGYLMKKKILISDPKIDDRKNLFKSSENLTILSQKDNDIKPIMIKKDEKSKFAPKLYTPKNNNRNPRQSIQKSNLDDKNSKKIDISYSNVDNSNIKICAKRKSLMNLIENKKQKNVEFNLKNCELNKIKNYMKNDYKKDNNQLKKFSSIDFIFPYYLYLLNIFNKSFGITKSCFANRKFLESWEYMINVFDVTEFIKMQTNIALINKILFELKTEDENNNYFSEI